MRLARRLLYVSLIVLTLLVGTGTAAVIVSQTAWFKNRLRVYVIAQAGQYLNGELSIGKLGGDLFSGVELEQITLSLAGRPVASIQDVGLEYNFIQLLTSGLTVDQLRLNKPVLYVRHDRDGWSLSKLIKKQEREADRRGPQFNLEIDTINITDGSVIVDDRIGTPGVRIPEQIDNVDAQLSFAYAPVRYSIDISHLSFRASKPDLAMNSASGGIAVRDDTIFLDSLAIRMEETTLTVDGAIQQYLDVPVLNLRVSSDKTSLPEVAAVVPSLAGIEQQPAFEIAASGPLDRLSIDMRARSSAGQLTGTVIADVTAPERSMSGTVSVRHLNLAPFFKGARQTSDITADAAIDLRTESLTNLDALAGTVTIDAPRIFAAGYAADRVNASATIDGRRISLNASAVSYGASATASGRLVLPEGRGLLTVDLRGRARHVDMKRFPRSWRLPQATTNLNADYHVAGTTPVSRSTPRPRLLVNAKFADSTVPGARVVSGSTVNIDTRPAQIAYSADAQVRDVDLQQIGRTFSVPALAADRYKSQIDAHVKIEGEGTRTETAEAIAQGTVTEATFMGGRLSQAGFDASIGQNTVQIKAVGAFAGFDPAVVSGKSELHGEVAGRLDFEARIEQVSTGVTPDNVDGTFRVALEPSSVGGLAIERGSLDADYRDRTGDIRQLEIVGPDANVTAQGTLALGDTGSSQLTFHADSSRLAELGKLADVSMTGVGRVDGTITGNRSELSAAGTLEGNGVTYEDHGALTVRANYAARVRDLAFRQATVEADTHATFVTIAGQEINEVTAKTSYAERRLTFDATAKQQRRSLDAAGSLILHPEHQEIHLERLGLATANQQWSVPPGEEPTIHYAQDSLTVDRFRLVSADQEIVADGRFGQPGASLHVTLKNVDLARVDELLLRPPQFSGRLNADARVEGTRERPHVSGQFQVGQGAFRDFMYDSLVGTLAYQPEGVTIDARLQQTADQWLTAKGYVPTTVFARSNADSSSEHPAGHVEPAASADRIDVTIDSSPLGLGIVQGFTNAVTDVQGTVEAHIRVTGVAADPHPTGSLTIADGVLTVPANGVTYSNIAGRVDLQPDRIHIDQITVLDNHQSALSLTGDLAVHQREIGDFHLWITADDFKIVDNEMGNVRIQSAMELVGELRAPELRGDFGITTGRVNLDEIIALTALSPYPTQSIEERASATDRENDIKPRSIFDALRMNVRFTVPDVLVISASSLQAPGAPVGLGALNVTVGGDLTAAKHPSENVRLIGSVNTVRGNYDFQGRHFEILRDGSVRFDGLEEFDARLDLRTRRMIQGVEARVNVRGTLKRPEIVLSSTPPLDQADILALVVFNQPINQLGVGQQISLAERAQQLATGAVAGQLSASIAKALNLELFELDVAPEGGGGPALTFGQQFGPNLYVKVQQGVGDQSTTNLIIEYAFKEWLRLQTNVVQGASTQQSLFQRSQGSGADLIFLFTK